MDGGNREGEKVPRSVVDLLQKLTSSASSSSSSSDYRAPNELPEGVELTLGLSLGGRFGVDRAPGSPSSKRLTKSSSIAGITPLPMEVQGTFEAEEMAASAVVGRGPETMRRPVLMRTTSMPVSRDEEEWRKRKEKQSLRRMEAKRRRSEKLRGYGSLGEIAGASSASPSSAAHEAMEWEDGIPPGPRSYTESRSFFINQLLQGRGSGQDSLHSSTPRAGAVPMEELVVADPRGPERERERVDNRGKEIGRSAVEELPCVFTKGEGPNGRRIEGILYKYGKGEELKIMCVCHGSFLSPAEFVRHAGGEEVANPLRHIVVNPNPNCFP
ncbi:hypothetical protein MLD38_011482 [Melastoma candidum]|uniref:Uncharacterized protein n=1 Tax=Melastoma candidum TaxID=119954 RepID=A0ACB9R397_9MYRT|nr:hypothetical protein MLD38_011482 [Melastoma candidum]